MRRILHVCDIILLTKYQAQHNTNLLRAMKALQDYRNNKARLIKGETVKKKAV